VILIALSGGIGHGKTTFAKYLALGSQSSHHWESSDLIIDIANALRSNNKPTPKPDDIAGINAWLRQLPAILKSEVHQVTNWQQLELSPRRLAETPENYTMLFTYLELMTQRP